MTNSEYQRMMRRRRFEKWIRKHFRVSRTMAMRVSRGMP